MGNHKPDGNRLLKKTHSTTQSLRRSLSLLLCLCMLVSMFSGLVSLPAFAQELDEPAQFEENFRAEAPEESPEEIKARLMRQIRYEGWDPYSGNMSMEEFYALMELFQEGALPLEEEEPVAEPVGPDFMEPAADQSAAAGGPVTGGNPHAGGPYAVEPDVAVPAPVTPGPQGPSAAAPILDGDGPDGPGGQDPEEPEPESIYIPRTMFLFDGLDTTNEPGLYRTYDEAGNLISSKPLGPPQVYNNFTNYEPYSVENKDGGEDIMYHYPAGLDPYNTYTRPPDDWPGITINGELKAKVIVLGTNAGNTSVSGDVNQNLFLQYTGKYIRQVSAQNNDVTVLGAIRLQESGSYIYYYTNNDLQSTEVSATTLPEGQKFIVHYAHSEHAISYTIRMYDSTKDKKLSAFNGDIAEWVRAMPEVTEEYERQIFSTDFPTRTDMGRYSFTATAPDGYTLSFFLSADNENGTWTQGTAQLVTYGDDFKKPGAYTSVNEGWALGMEPVYRYVNKAADGKEEDKLLPDLSQGPQMVTTTATFYNDDVTGDRIVAAVLQKKDDPKFDARTIVTSTTKANGRGSSAVMSVSVRKRSDPNGNKITVPYDYEDEYLWRKETGRINNGNAGTPNPEYEGRSTYIDYTVANPIGNITSGDTWSWNNAYPAITNATMNKDADGTYSYQWTFQGNSGNFLLDSLEINREGVTIPFFPKYAEAIDPNGIEVEGSDEEGTTAWFANTTLSDGAKIKVEYLVRFGGVQRVYRITVTNATNNITVTNMNMMMYSVGADEFSVYQLDGVTGATNKSDHTRKAAIQDYERGHGWSENINRGAVVVDRIDYAGRDVSTGHGDWGDWATGGVTWDNWGDDGDSEDGGPNWGAGGQEDGDPGGNVPHNWGAGGANLRFKLASGYGSPYYLYESTKEQVIHDLDGTTPQASATRSSGGIVSRNAQNPVVPYISDGTDPYMRYAKAKSEQDGGSGPGDGGSGLEDGGIDLDEFGLKEGQPYPVASDGSPLYYYKEDGKGNRALTPFTDWTSLRISSEVVPADGGFTEEEILVPALYREDGTPLSIDEVIVPKNTMVFRFDYNVVNNVKIPVPLKPDYIYSGLNGWHYIRLTNQNNKSAGGTYKIALLTIVARPIRYVVRYKPGMILTTGEILEGPFEADYFTNMPNIEHSASCPTFLQGDPEQDATDDRVKNEFDDNSGFFYDIEVRYTAGVNTSRPTEKTKEYEFVDWVLVDENDVPVRKHVLGNNNEWATYPDGSFITEEVHYTSGSLNVRELAEYAILNDDLGTTANDIYVLRLMPTWDKIDHPFHYEVTLSWIDAQGVLRSEYISNWDVVLTDFDPKVEGSRLTVKVLTDATPFQNWIAQHPTYTFWNPVNNAMDGPDYDPEGHPEWGTPEYAELDEDEKSSEDKIQDALAVYFPPQPNDPAEAKKWQEAYNRALTALLGSIDRNNNGIEDFDRQDMYVYTVNEDEGTIAIWMYEDKGGLVFHKDVNAESFIYDDEFYFTVKDVTVEAETGEVGLLNDTYKAYPEKVFDEEGNERELLDRDAWLVTFKDGNIVDIVPNDGVNFSDPEKPVNYFTLRSGEGVQLYVPGGKYTITELGSKSGGSYMARVKYLDANGKEQPPKKDDWNIPNDPDKNYWLMGSEKEYRGEAGPDGGNPQFPEGVSQISATVDFVIGAHDVVSTLNFSNQTSAIAFEERVVGAYDNDEFGFDVTLELQGETGPLHYEGGGQKYDYFNFNLYGVEYGRDDTVSERKPDGAPSDWRPDGTLTPVYTGRAKVALKNTIYNQDGTVKSTTWAVTSLLVQGRDRDGALLYDGNGEPKLEPAPFPEGVWLKNSQRFYVVCTVPDDRSEINYTISETNRQGYQLMGDITRNGHAVAAELAYEMFINFKRFFPATGGAGIRMLQISGAVFLLSGLGLAWLNRDLWEKRKGRFKR